MIVLQPPDERPDAHTDEGSDHEDTGNPDRRPKRFSQPQQKSYRHSDSSCDGMIHENHLLQVFAVYHRKIEGTVTLRRSADYYKLWETKAQIPIILMRRGFLLIQTSNYIPTTPQLNQ